MIITTMLCRYNKGCFGCCGTEHCKSKEEVINTIKTNTKELKDYKDLKTFRNRKGPLFPIKDSGIKGLCPNVTKLKDNTYGCALHPKQNDKDYRGYFCYRAYLCETQKQFQSWDKETQKDFLNYLKSLNLDVYDFSIQMDNDKILKNYINKKKNQKT